ncbi:MAG: glycoside hydrolase, partial [Parasphingorhabdus sp.]|nr:glycoside hydrolase [Parasphingorhabdus sp.]
MGPGEEQNIIMSSSLADNAPRKHFALHGPERAFDPRVTAYRGDLADIALAGHLFAPHYAEPMARRCIMPSAMLYGQPDRRKPAVSQLLHGEPFQVLAIR